MTAGTGVERALTGLLVPAEGLVLRATHLEPTSTLTDAQRALLVHWAEGAPDEDFSVCGSTDEDGHWAEVTKVSPRYWVTSHVDNNWDVEEYRLFASFDDAYDHYAELVTGQQDAMEGKAWRDCDVPGVLAGEDLRLADRVGLSYADAARQYREDRGAAVAAWSLMDALI